MTVIHSLTLLQLISIFAASDIRVCCAGNCNSCNIPCTNCCRNNVCCGTWDDCCKQACQSTRSQCNNKCQVCGNNCGNCCITEECCQELPSCPTTCGSGNSSSSTFASTITTSSTDNSSSSTFTPSFASTTTMGITDNSSSSTFAATTTMGITDAKESNSPVVAAVAAVVSCLVALCVVVAVVVGLFLWRRKQQSQGVRTENSSICCSAAANPEDGQNSFHVYDKLSLEHKKADNDKEPENIPDKTSNDDEYIYIDDFTISNDAGRLREDHQPATTATEQPTNANPFVGGPLAGSGLHPDLPSPYRQPRAVNNDFPDSQPPDYFILETGEKGCADPTQYFTLEERGETNSAADTDTQQYFILEEKQEGEGKESAPQIMSPGSGADYFVLERPNDPESDCAGVARGPPEDAEYSRLDPNGFEQSEYTVLTSTEQQVSAMDDNPYSLASSVE